MKRMYREKNGNSGNCRSPNPNMEFRTRHVYLQEYTLVMYIVYIGMYNIEIF